MPEAHKRTKDPKAVKRRLMDEAIRLAVEKGLSAVTVQAVSSAADVTKGGFLHHFPSKQALIDAIFNEVLDSIAAEIEVRVQKDPVRKGAFTRAYANLAFGGQAPAMGHTWITLSILMLDDLVLRQKWTTWFHTQLDLYKEDVNDPELSIVRLAVDGAWMAQYVGLTLPDRKALYEKLMRLASPAS